jgi:hypothetical protein
LRPPAACGKRGFKELIRNQDMIMADTKHAPHGGYSPDMDGRSHEETYQGFIRFAEIATAVILCWVLSLAVGGIKHAWMSALIGVILAPVAGFLGAMVPAIGFRAPAAVGVLLILVLLIY